MGSLAKHFTASKTGLSYGNNITGQTVLDTKPVGREDVSASLAAEMRRFPNTHHTCFQNKPTDQPTPAAVFSLHLLTPLESRLHHPGYPVLNKDGARCRGLRRAALAAAGAVPVTAAA